ncbi:MAG: CoA-binding protein [Planctomycetes bacterium]|nr:CoA-binding protein [Planctomycetota bacterium]
MDDPRRTNAKPLESPAEIRRLLETAKTLAVVGLSERPERDSHSIAAYLQGHGYRIVGVHPTASRILGSPVYPSLSAIPEEERREVSLVVVFRKAEDAPAVIEEAAGLGLKAVWLPPGAASEAGVRAALERGMSVVAGACLRVAHSRLVARRP